MPIAAAIAHVSRSDRSFRLAFAGLLAALSIAPCHAADSSAENRLDAVERAVEESREAERELATRAEALARQLAGLRLQLVATASRTQDDEERVSSLEARLAGLEDLSTAKAAALDRQRDDLAALLGALQRLARTPPEALLVLPGTPTDTVRSGRLLAAMMPPIEAKAAALARELDEIAELRAQTEAERRSLDTAQEALAADRERLAGLIARRGTLLQETETAHEQAAERTARLSREARDLRELLRAIAAERTAKEAAERTAREAAARASLRPRPAGPPAAAQPQPSPPPADFRRFGEAQGHVTPPVRGQIVLSFGQAGQGGQSHRGITIETRPDARVVAPFDGQIVFNGPFRGYGQILIIEHSDGYHTLLTGLGRIDVAVGQWVAAGEPVATAPGPESGSGQVYLELRRNGQPINPLPWLATWSEKVSG